MDEEQGGQVEFDIEKHLREDLPVNSFCVLYYFDGSMRTGKVLRHMEGKIVLENVEAGWRSSTKEYRPEVTYTEIFIPVCLVKEYGLAK